MSANAKKLDQEFLSQMNALKAMEAKLAALDVRAFHVDARSRLSDDFRAVRDLRIIGERLLSFYGETTGSKTVVVNLFAQLGADLFTRSPIAGRIAARAGKLKRGQLALFVMSAQVLLALVNERLPAPALFGKVAHG